MINEILNWDQDTPLPEGPAVVAHDEFKALPPAEKVRVLNKLQSGWSDMLFVDDEKAYPGDMRDLERWFGESRQGLLKDSLAEDLRTGKLTEKQVEAFAKRDFSGLDDTTRQYVQDRYGDPGALEGPWKTQKLPITGADGKQVGYQYIRRRSGLNGQNIAKNMGVPEESWNQAGYVQYNADPSNESPSLAWQNPDEPDNIEVAWTVQGNDGQEYSGVENVSAGEEFAKLADSQRSMAFYQGMGDPGMAGPSRELSAKAELPDIVGSEGLPAALAAEAVSERLRKRPEIAGKIGQGFWEGLPGEAAKGFLTYGSAALHGVSALTGNKDALKDYEKSLEYLDADFEGQSQLGFRGEMSDKVLKGISAELPGMAFSMGASAGAAVVRKAVQTGARAAAAGLTLRGMTPAAAESIITSGGTRVGAQSGAQFAAQRAGQTTLNEGLAAGIARGVLTKITDKKSLIGKLIGTADLESKLVKNISDRVLTSVSFLPSAMRSGLDNMSTTLDAAEDLRKQGKTKEADALEESAMKNGWAGVFIELGSEAMWLNELMVTKAGRSFGDVATDVLGKKIGAGKLAQVTELFKRTVVGGNQEGIEEIVAGVGNRAWMNQFAGQNQDVFAGIDEEYLTGAALGGVISGIKAARDIAPDKAAMATEMLYRSVLGDQEAKAFVADVRARAEARAAAPQATPTPATPSSEPPAVPVATPWLDKTPAVSEEQSSGQVVPESRPVPVLPVEPTPPAPKAGTAGTVAGPKSGYAKFPADAIFQRAIEVVIVEKKASVALIQRRLKIGYARAVELLERMVEIGIVARDESGYQHVETSTVDGHAKDQGRSGADASVATPAVPVATTTAPVTPEPVAPETAPAPVLSAGPAVSPAPVTTAVPVPRAFAPIAPMPEERTPDEVARMLYDARADAVDVANDAVAVPGAGVAAEALASIAADEELPTASDVESATMAEPADVDETDFGNIESQEEFDGTVDRIVADLKSGNRAGAMSVFSGLSAADIEKVTTEITGAGFNDQTRSEMLADLDNRLKFKRQIAREVFHDLDRIRASERAERASKPISPDGNIATPSTETPAPPLAETAQEPAIAPAAESAATPEKPLQPVANKSAVWTDDESKRADAIMERYGPQIDEVDADQLDAFAEKFGVKRRGKSDSALREEIKGQHPDDILAAFTGKPTQQEPTTETGRQVKEAFAGMASAATEGARRRVAELIDKGPYILENKAAGDAALANPDYRAERLPDGRVQITDVVNPDTGTWHKGAKAPARDATKPEQMTPDEFTETMDIESSGITLTPAVKSHLKQLRDTASYVMRKSPQEAARMLKDVIEYLENKVSQLKRVMALKERLEPIDEKRRLEWEAKNQKEIAAEWWAEDVGIPEAVASIEATGRASKALASLVKIWQSKQSDKVKAAIENESPVSAAAVDAYKITIPAGYEKQGELYVFAGNKSESKPAESNEKPSQVTETAPKSVKPPTKARALAAVGKFASRDKDRPVLNFIRDDGKTLVASDGKRLIQVGFAGDGTVDAPVYHKGHGRVKEEMGDRKYPNFKAVIPADGDLTTELNVDITRLSDLIERAEGVWKNHKDHGITLVGDAGGNIGLVASTGDESFSDGFDADSSYIIGSFDAGFIGDILDSAADFGHSSLTLKFRDVTYPATLEAKGFQAVIMGQRTGVDERDFGHRQPPKNRQKQPATSSKAAPGTVPVTLNSPSGKAESNLTAEEIQDEIRENKFLETALKSLIDCLKSK